MNEVIMKTEYSKAFDEKRKGLIEQSYYKYGPAHLNFATGNVDDDWKFEKMPCQIRRNWES